MRIKDSKPVSFITKIFRRKGPNKFKKKNSAIGKTQEGWENSRETIQSILSRTSSNKSGSSSNNSNAISNNNARRKSNADVSNNVGGISNPECSFIVEGSNNAGGNNNAGGSNNTGGHSNARDSNNAEGSNNAGGVGGGGGTFLEFMRLRKKILLFREIFDIPALNGSVAIHELVTATIEDLNNMYPDLIPGNPILKMKERNTHQGLICLYHVLDCIADSWVEEKSMRDKFKFKKPHIETSPLDELVELVLEILDYINNAAKERFELMDVELKHECSSSIKVKPKPKQTADHNSEYSRSPVSISPHTPTSVFPDSPRVADLLGAMLGSYSSPQLLNLRAHAVEKLSPFDLKRLVVQVMPQFASNDNFHQNPKSVSIEETNLEAKEQATIEPKGIIVDNDVRDEIDNDWKMEEEQVQEDDEEKEMKRKTTLRETEDEVVENVQPQPLPSITSPSPPDILPENAISTPSSPLTLIVSPRSSTPLGKSSPTSPNYTKITSPPPPPPLQMPATTSSTHLPPPPPSHCYSLSRTHTPQPQPLGKSFLPLPPPPPHSPLARDNGEHLPPRPVSGAAPPPPPPVPSATPPPSQTSIDNGGHLPQLSVPSAAPLPPSPLTDNGAHHQPPPVIIAAPPPPSLATDNEGHLSPPLVRRVPSSLPPPVIVTDNEGHPPPPAVVIATPPPPPLVMDNEGHLSPPLVRCVPSPSPPPVTDNEGHPPPPPPVPSAAPPPSPSVTNNGGHSSPPPVPIAAPLPPPPVMDNGGHQPPPIVSGAIPPPPQPIMVNGGHPLPPPVPGVVPPPPQPVTNNGGHPPPPGSMMKGDAVPPPPGGMRNIVRPRNRSKLRRSTHMGNLYRILRGKVEGSCLPEGKPSQANKTVTNGGNAGGGTSMADALAEMTKRSAYFQQIEGDMAKHGSAIKELQRDLTTFKTSDMDELLKFHLRVESLLELLTDETQILSRFENFPMKKLETLRMAAALFMKLNGIVLEIQNWKPKSPLAENLDKLEKYFNKIKSELEGLERTKDEESKKFQSQNIYFDFSIFTKIKESMVDLSSGFIELALKERGEAKEKVNDKTDGTHMLSVKMLWRAFQFAFKVYSFAGGQDERADSLTRELAKEIETDPMQE